MPVDLASSIGVYASMVRHLSSYEEQEEVLAALIWRDEVHEELLKGVSLAPDLSAELVAADDLLVRQRERLVERFPDAFHPDRKRNRSRDYWWWYLDEGPQVREEAGRAA